ncbi:MAG: ATPase [Stenotrophomonas sp.]|jgi:hypothetical protein|nr:MAG: ATPase [Stenotrophomonas sp.]
MPILRILSVLAVLVFAVAAWLAVLLRDVNSVHVLSGEMASASATAAGGLPTSPPADIHWQPLDQQTLASWRGPYWLRWQSPASTQPDDGGRALRLSLRGASQLYWNGQPMQGNGVVGTSAEQEQPGQVDITRVLPPSSPTGTDELLVLASSHHQQFGLYSADALVAVAPAVVSYQRMVLPWLIAALATGALAAACLYFLALQHGRPQMPGGRLLLALCAVGIALPVVEGWRPLLGYLYPWHGLRLYALLALHVAAAMLLPAYLARRYGVAVPKGLGITYAAALVMTAVLLPSFDIRSAVALLLSLLASSALLLRANSEREERWPILALLVAGVLALLFAPGAFLDGPYFLLLAVLVGFLLLCHAEQVRNLDLHNARLREERASLSLQLLQRGIQPHWLMNTLTCLQELIEQAPAKASRLVESLAEQFDRLRESSSSQSVPLSEELALCRNHLDIVGQALDQPMTLEVDADDLQLSLPPGVLHAQVENALTHAGAVACAQRPFRLRVQRDKQHWILELRSARGSAPHRGQGTGTRYIEASLAASYPNRWHYSQGADGADWCSRIELTCAY